MQLNACAVLRSLGMYQAPENTQLQRLSARDADTWRASLDKTCHPIQRPSWTSGCCMFCSASPFVCKGPIQCPSWTSGCCMFCSASHVCAREPLTTQLHGRGAHPGQVPGQALDERHLAAHAQLVPARQHGQLRAQRLLAHRAHLGGVLRAGAACATAQAASHTAEVSNPLAGLGQSACIQRVIAWPTARRVLARSGRASQRALADVEKSCWVIVGLIPWAAAARRWRAALRPCR